MVNTSAISSLGSPKPSWAQRKGRTSCSGNSAIIGMSVSRRRIAFSWNFGRNARGKPNLGWMSANIWCFSFSGFIPITASRKDWSAWQIGRLSIKLRFHFLQLTIDNLTLIDACETLVIEMCIPKSNHGTGGHNHRIHHNHDDDDDNDDDEKT